MPVLPERAGTVSLCGGIAVRKLVPLCIGERIVGLAPLGERAAGSLRLALGTRQGMVKICVPDWPVRAEEFDVLILKR